MYICGSFTIFSEMANTSALILSSKPILNILKKKLVMKTILGSLTMRASIVSRVCECGPKEHVIRRPLVYLWFGESQKTVAQIVTFV